jgi:hypothetical protein
MYHITGHQTLTSLQKRHLCHLAKTVLPYATDLCPSCTLEDLHTALYTHMALWQDCPTVPAVHCPDHHIFTDEEYDPDLANFYNHVVTDLCST